MLRSALAASRYIILIPVICVFIGSAVLTIYAGIETFSAISTAFSLGVSGKAAKQLIIDFIEIVDLFLLGTVLYVIAVGLYELFIDDSIPMPEWLVIHTLDDLKEKLIGVVIVVLGVLFLGQVISWDGQRDLLSFGIAISAIIASLSLFLGTKSKKEKATAKDYDK